MTQRAEETQIESTDTKASEPKAPEKKPPRRFSNAWWKLFWWEQVWPLVLLLAALFSVRSAIADWNVVPTGSMKPTIIEGDRIFVNKLAYDLKIPFTTIHLAKWSDPKRGEIVVFDSPEDGTRLVKRVVAVPGDTVQLVNNVLIINGQPAEYDKLDKDTIDQVETPERNRHGYSEEVIDGIKHPVMSTPEIEGAMRNFGPVTVPKNEYFMMGDNRDNSKDSRYIGFVPRDNIVGRSSRVIMSLNYDNYYIPRLERWFRPLP